MGAMGSQQRAEPAVEKILYRPREAAMALGVSPAYVYARLTDGSLRGIRLAGRAIRIRRGDLEVFAQGPGAGA
jgi:excisionase family DNA binding protein